jgi:hypothetical protein
MIQDKQEVAADLQKQIDTEILKKIEELEKEEALELAAQAK